MKKNKKSINFIKAILGISALCVIALPASSAPDLGNINPTSIIQDVNSNYTHDINSIRDRQYQQELKKITKGMNKNASTRIIRLKKTRL